MRYSNAGTGYTFYPLSSYLFGVASIIYDTPMKLLDRFIFSSLTDGQRIRQTFLYMYSRAREIDKCKSVRPFHKQSAISVSFTETTDRPFPRSRKLPIGSFRNDRLFPDIR